MIKENYVDLHKNMQEGRFQLFTFVNQIGPYFNVNYIFKIY